MNTHLIKLIALAIIGLPLWGAALFAALVGVGILWELITTVGPGGQVNGIGVIGLVVVWFVGAIFAAPAVLVSILFRREYRKPHTRKS